MADLRVAEMNNVGNRFQQRSEPMSRVILCRAKALVAWTANVLRRSLCYFTQRRWQLLAVQQTRMLRRLDLLEFQKREYSAHTALHAARSQGAVKWKSPRCRSCFRRCADSEDSFLH